ncbi:hypothetical protein TrVE_jg8671 [Triparma verrucosa]|uniref:Glycosyltransferase family 32 protein n=1 Tax=Triparma verrucosa TaxID=1606542 RepID=A0A9W7B6C3_9STRA|nr:hypothetical protein TrVE_jg8671 [Triparma verrucosa]
MWTFENAQEKRAFIGQLFVPQVLDGYEKLVAAGARSQAENLFKFCVLYKFGGTYVSPGVTISGPVPLNTNIVLESGFSPAMVDISYLSTDSRSSPFMKGMISFVILNLGEVIHDSLLIESRMRERIVRTGTWTVLNCSCWRHDAISAGNELEYNDPGRPSGSPPIIILTKGAHSSLPSEIRDRLKTMYPRLGLHEASALGSVGGYWGNNKPVDKPLLPASLDCDQCLKRSKGGGSCKLCESCSSFCNSLCTEATRFGGKINIDTVTMEVVPPGSSEITIPLIVHQTWTSAAPVGSKMAKMQAGWKRSGFEYHFYDDSSARQFISLNFPTRILEAYDSIIPAGLKTDFLKLSVLLLHGGVWADIDVLLETNLLSVLAGYSFVGVVEAKRKHQAFCIYNGFIAATPNHPFIRSAFERIVTNVLNQFKENDITGEFLCGRGWNKGSDTDPKIWHIRANALSYLTGPCNLGLGVKQVIGLNAFASIKPGVLNDGDLQNVPGESLFLEMKTHDFGSWRASDRSGKVVIATNFADFDLDALHSVED